MGNGENNEVTGEALWGISVAQPGPITTNVIAYPNPVAAGSSVSLTANIDNSSTGCSDIDSAEYSLDGGGWILMNAADGNFDAEAEDVEKYFAAPSQPSIYDVCVRGTDVVGTIGDHVCIMLVVYDPDGVVYLQPP